MTSIRSTKAQLLDALNETEKRIKELEEVLAKARVVERENERKMRQLIDRTKTAAQELTDELKESREREAVLETTVHEQRHALIQAETLHAADRRRLSHATRVLEQIAGSGRGLRGKRLTLLAGDAIHDLRADGWQGD